MHTARDYDSIRYSLLIGRLKELSSNETLAQRSALGCLLTVTWFESCDLGVRGVRGPEDRKFKGAARIGRCLWPERYSTEDKNGPARKDRRIERYARGENEVSKAYWDASKKLPLITSLASINMLIEALDTTKPVGVAFYQQLHLVAPVIRRAIFEKNSKTPCHSRPLPTLAALASHASTEAVAVLVFLLRKAHEAGDGTRARGIGELLYSIVLIWCARHPIYGCRSVILLYFLLFIFPMADDGDVCIDPKLYQMHDAIECLRYHVYQCNWMPSRMRNTVLDGPSDGWEKLLDALGPYGSAYAFALKPPLLLLRCVSDSHQAAKDVAWRWVSRIWGWRRLRLLSKYSLPEWELFELARKGLTALTQADVRALETKDEYFFARYFAWMASPLNTPNSFAHPTESFG